MTLKSISSVVLVALSMSACILTGGDKKEVTAVSPTPKVTKASLQSKPEQMAKPSAAAKCDGTKGFCALPGLKKRKPTE